VGSGTATVACSSCGALNAGDFSNCIRCNQPLKGATPADKAARKAPQLRVEGPPRARVVLGKGEKLLGRWEATSLPVTKLILAINLAVFALQSFALLQVRPSLGDLFMPDSDLTYLTIAFQYGGMPPKMVWQGHELFRLLSACFVHFGLLHVGMNMYGLIHLSRLVEPALGSVRYLIAYVGTGIIGFVLSVSWSAYSGQFIFTAGASGAVFGVMGMVLGFLWRRRDPRWKTWLVQAVVISLLFTFMLGPGINHAAHIGGLLSGMVFGALFAKDAPKPSALWQRILGWLCLAACLGSLVAAQVSPLNEAYARDAEQDRLRQIVEPKRKR
jgi:membrane associated rhomboid family serine protease